MYYQNVRDDIFMYRDKRHIDIGSVIGMLPSASADIYGNNEHWEINGSVKFYQMTWGVLVIAEIRGLPSPTEKCESPVFGFHIHEGALCSGHSGGSFSDTMSHYNPGNCQHPHHAGDMPPLFGNSGYAFSAFMTDRFSVDDIVGKTVIIHSGPDDFTTQPAGNSGKKIACGEIRGHGRFLRNK